MGARSRQYAELTEIYEELEQAEKLHRRLGCPVIDISDLSIEETAHRVLRVIEETEDGRVKNEKGSVPLRYWIAVVARDRRRGLRLLRPADADLDRPARRRVARRVPRAAQSARARRVSSAVLAVRPDARSRPTPARRRPRAAPSRRSARPLRRRARSRPGSPRGRAACRPAAAAPRRRSAGRRCRAGSRAVAHPLELRAERVGHARLEPADHPGAPAGEDDAGFPGLAEDPVEAVHAPDREHVRRVAAADEDDVVRERELAQVCGRPRIERERRDICGELGRDRTVGSRSRRRAPCGRGRAAGRTRASRRSGSRRDPRFAGSSRRYL